MVFNLHCSRAIVRGRHLLHCHAMLGSNMNLGVSFLTIRINKVNSQCDPSKDELKNLVFYGLDNSSPATVEPE